MADLKKIIPLLPDKIRARLGRCFTSDIHDELARLGHRVTWRHLVIALNELHERGDLLCGVYGMGDPRHGGYIAPFKRSKLRDRHAPGASPSTGGHE